MLGSSGGVRPCAVCMKLLLNDRVSVLRSGVHRSVPFDVSAKKYSIFVDFHMFRELRGSLESFRTVPCYTIFILRP